MSQKIRIKLKSYDHNLVDKSAEKIVRTVKTTGAIVSGPIPLPTHKRIFTVNRSTFVNKKSREQFELSSYKRLIDIYSSTAKTVDALMKLELPSGVEVYEINGPYFFGIATKFEEIMSELGDRPKVRIVRMRKVPFIDSTGIHNLTNLCEMSKKENIQIVLSGVNEKVHQILEKSGFNELLGKENICPNINVALEKAKGIIEE